jgi:hypothetical protein
MECKEERRNEEPEYTLTYTHPPFFILFDIEGFGRGFLGWLRSGVRIAPVLISEEAV